MRIFIKKAIGEKLGDGLKFLGVTKESWRYGDGIDVDLRMPAVQLDKLDAALRDHADKQGVNLLIKDIERWREAVATPGEQKARTVMQFEGLLIQFVSKSPGFRLCKNVDGVWLPYYVTEIKYSPASKRNGYEKPEDVDMVLAAREFGATTSETVSFESHDLRGLKVSEALSRKGWCAETPAIRAEYMAYLERFNAIADKVGRQFLCSGFGTLDVDGNPGDGYRWNTDRLGMESTDGPARVVLDVFFEEHANRERAGGGGNPRSGPRFWTKALAEKRQKFDGSRNQVEWDDNEDAESVEEMPEIPVHPFVAVFHMGKHLRVKVHVSQLADYVYNLKLSDKLILSPERKDLVKLLIDERSGGFKDIVKGKSGGAIVMLAGPPGTGKTLTAEVFAESEERALYSVQCSQLGTDPEDLEAALLKVFTRAKRWNAVTLLDEADVYIHERGNNLSQNAIVGVFLRVLEYQDAVLFLTTNRPDDVDDAVASRCIARLAYQMPNADEQRRIWAVLSENTGTTLAPDVIAEIVQEHPWLSGRDVKNLLKLARMVEGGVTPASVRFVKQFQPTKSPWKAGA